MNIFHLPALPLDEEVVTVLSQNKDLRIERIISTGQTSDWYDQEESEFVVLVQGRGDIEFKDKPPVHLREGDCILLPPHELHRVTYTSADPPCIWLCIFW